MIHSEEIESDAAIELTLPPINEKHFRTRARVAELAVGSPSDGVILSGTQLLWSCVSALSFVGLLLWAILKLWVYE
ncbi:MAG TPA: hypothetical protein VMH20_03125 [Verrucomicrobiae bacterium]|nr:hypothetical protein [Verrucomicrobiae bacterium]